MIKVVLSDTEIALCTHIGKLRNQITSQHAKDRLQDLSQDGVGVSVRGTITEYAVAKRMGVFFDLNCDYRKFGADLVSKRNNTIDVKCAARSGGSLNAVRWSDTKPVDLFVLTELEGNTVTMVGYIWSKDFLVPENLTDVGNGLFYSIPQSALIPFSV